jgi:hypothetical protein
MNVVAYDPYLQPARAAQLGVTLMELDDLRSSRGHSLGGCANFFGHAEAGIGVNDQNAHIFYNSPPK